MILPALAVFGSLAQGTLYRPSLFETLVNCCITYAYYFSPLFDSECLPVKRQVTAIAAIVHLSKRNGPSAIARLIIAIIVDAVKGVFVARPWPHIRIKALKGIKPSLAYFGTSPAICRVGMVIRLGATVKHLAPGFVFRRIAKSVCPTGVVAAAGDCTPASQRGCCLDCLVATLAATQPLGVLESVAPNVAKHRQASKLAAGKIVFQTIGNGYNLVSHVRTSSTNVMRGLRGVRCTLQSLLFYHNGAYGQLGQGPRIGS